MHMQINLRSPLDKSSHFLCDFVLHQWMGLTVQRGRCCKNSVTALDIYCKCL